MLRPFGPNASNIYNNTVSSWQTSKENYEGLLINTKQSSRSKKKHQPFSNGDVKKLMTSKDNVLVKIMEEHELEMDALTSDIEGLRQEDQRRKSALRKKRKRVKWVGILSSGILLALGIIVDIRVRQSINKGIELAREAESTADRERIAQLNAEKKDLEKKLGVIEGTVRYQVNRSNNIEAKSQSVEKQIIDLDRKELAEKEDIEHCFASHLGLTEDLKREKLNTAEVDEELVWCQSRLRSQERELNGLEHANVEGTSERGIVASSMVKSDIAPKGHKPVYLEMKYNKSIRNSIFLRQIYSAVAGVAVSALLQGLVPAAIKLFAPKVMITMLPAPVPPVPTRGLEMVLVDGVFGSSVVFLLIQAIATFLMPL